MRKSLLLLIALFCVFLKTGYGQPFNEKFFYNIAGPFQVINPSDIIVDGNGYSCVIGNSSLSTPGIGTDFIIQKTDFSGTIAMRKYYNLNNPQGVNANIQMTKVVKTK